MDTVPLEPMPEAPCPSAEPAIPVKESEHAIDYAAREQH